jgi:hypothetical protein
VTGAIKVKVVRIDVARWTAAQFLVSVGLAVNVVARRWGSLAFKLATVGFWVVVSLMMLRARRHLGWRDFRAGKGQIRLGDSEISRAAFLYWVRNEGVARLAGGVTGWILRARKGEGAALEAALTRAFGPALPLRRRGTPLARGMAAGLSFGGLAALGVGVGADTPAVGFVGAIAAFLAVSAWLTLSRRGATLPEHRSRTHN